MVKQEVVLLQGENIVMGFTITIPVTDAVALMIDPENPNNENIVPIVIKEALEGFIKQVKDDMEKRPEEERNVVETQGKNTDAPNDE
jgi:hypothetical protein